MSEQSPIKVEQPAATAPTPGSASAPTWARLHLWQIQWVRDLMVVALIFGVIYLGYQIRLVTVPMLLALLLAYLFEPLVRWLRTRRLCSRKVAALGIIVAAFFVIVVPVTVGAGFGIVQGAKAVRDLATDVAKVQKSVANPEDEALKAAVPPGAWSRIRDFLAERPSRSGETTGPTPPTPEDGSTPPVAEAVPEEESLLARMGGKDDLRELVQRGIDWLSDHAGELSASVGRRVASGGADAARAAIATFTSIGMLMFQAGLTAVFFYFFSTGWGRVLDFWERFIPVERRGRAAEILGQMDRAIAGFVRGRVTICFILAMLITLLYWLAGVPAPLILGPVVGMLFLIPYVHVVGVPIAMLLMWLNGVEGPILAPHLASGSGGLWWILGAPIGIYLIAQVADDWILSPTIQGKATDLAIPTIVFASLAGGALAGVYGLLLAIPVAACVRILAKELFWPRLKAWARGEASDVLPIGR